LQAYRKSKRKKHVIAPDWASNRLALWEIRQFGLRPTKAFAAAAGHPNLNTTARSTIADRHPEGVEFEYP
jgi:hypothetical protein